MIIIITFIAYPVLGHVHILIQSEISGEGLRVFSLSNSNFFIFLKVVEKLLMSPSLFSLPFYISFNSVLYKTVPTQDVTNPVSLPSL